MNLDGVVFYSNDLDKVIDFYKDIVGLTIEYQQDNKYVSFIFPNGIRLGIKKADSSREKPGSQTIIISVEDIETLYKKFISQGIKMYQELTNESWGITFSILDPDDNKLEFLKGH